MCQCRVAQLVRVVVMITMEGAAGESDSIGERVQFLV
jgi:hypothetical protein